MHLSFLLATESAVEDEKKPAKKTDKKRSPRKPEIKPEPVEGNKIHRSLSVIILPLFKWKLTYC